jgi:hypothetical protein
LGPGANGWEYAGGFGLSLTTTADGPQPAMKIAIKTKALIKKRNFFIGDFSLR